MEDTLLSRQLVARFIDENPEAADRLKAEHAARDDGERISHANTLAAAKKGREAKLAPARAPLAVADKEVETVSRRTGGR